MGITYWFYLYIVWFFPLVIIALVFAHPPGRGERDGPAPVPTPVQAPLTAVPALP